MDRAEQLRRLYSDVFLGREDTIPLLVTPPCPGAPTFDDWWRDIPSTVAQAAAALRPKAEVGADWLPTVNVSLYQCVAVPALYGAQIVKQDGSEPMCRPCFASLADAVDAGTPRVDGPMVDEVVGSVRAARRALPEGWFLSFPVTASPFDLAQLLLGDAFLVGLLTSPDDAQTFLMHLAQAGIALTETVKAELGQGRHECVTNRGMFFPGLRLPCDAVVNYSPDTLRAAVLPVLARFGQAFGPLCIHFCTEPAPSAHVLPVLVESGHVAAVDNWQGLDVFLGDDAPARLQDRVAVVGDVDLRTPEKMDAFLAKEVVRSVPRRGGRGLVLGTSAESVDAGRRIYDAWQERMADQGLRG